MVLFPVSIPLNVGNSCARTGTICARVRLNSCSAAAPSLSSAAWSELLLELLLVEDLTRSELLLELLPVEVPAP